MTTIFCSAAMLHPHIQDSKLKLPDDFRHYDPEEYPHFHVFVTAHVGLPVEIDLLQNNADIIAAIPEERIREVTFSDLFKLGVVLGETALD